MIRFIWIIETKYWGAKGEITSVRMNQIKDHTGGFWERPWNDRIWWQSKVIRNRKQLTKGPATENSGTWWKGFHPPKEFLWQKNVILLNILGWVVFPQLYSDIIFFNWLSVSETVWGMLCVCVHAHTRVPVGRYVWAELQCLLWF